MKTKNIFKVLLTLAIALVVNVSLMAQYPPSPFALYDANETVPTAIDSATTGMTLPYYVLPDAYYHPNYVALGQLTTGFQWDWEISTNPGGAAIVGAADTANYVEVTWGAAGDYVLRVSEVAPAAYGGCDGDTTIMNVTVLPVPTLGFEPTAIGSYIGDSIQVCEGDAQLTDIVTVNITGITPFNLIWDFEIATMDATNTKDEWFDTDKTTNYGVQTYAVEYTAAAPDSVTTTAYDLQRPDDGVYDCIGGKTTVYTYSITGVNGRISRKSDYLINTSGANAGFNYWDYLAANNVGAAGNTADGVEIIVNPRPDTGPIYHIPNNWAE
ncbi:MAG: hypothetical protein JXB49_11050 [Bacteroidales bacterium]|nr:hypothetical protein [Bacteroidales bacterium]